MFVLRSKSVLLGVTAGLLAFIPTTIHAYDPPSDAAPTVAQGGKYLGGKVDFKVTSKDLVREFVATPDKAKTKYKGKTLRVEGVISSIRVEKSDDSTTVSVYLEGDGTLTVETLLSEKEGSGLKEGQKIAVFGADVGYSAGELVSLYHCELAPK